MDYYSQGQNREPDHRMEGICKAKGDPNREFGFVTLLVLILFTMLSAYGLEMYLKAHLENKMVRREANSRQAVYAAEGGIEWVKVKLDGDSAFSGGRLKIGEGTVDVMVTEAPSGYRVTSVAQNGLAKRRLEVNLVKSMNHWVITEYQELHADE